MVGESKDSGGDVLWVVLDVGISSLCTFLMGLEGRGTLVPSSSIPGPVSLPISIQASAEVSLSSYPTNPFSTAGENREQNSIAHGVQVCADVRNSRQSIETTTLKSGQSHGKHVEKAIGK
jgi:hypothetical protein